MARIDFTPLTEKSLSRLTLDERMAFLAAAGAVAGDQKPSLEVIATLVLTVQRLTGEAASVRQYRVVANGDGDTVFVGPCAETVGCLFHRDYDAFDGVTLGELADAALEHEGPQGERAHAFIAEIGSEEEADRG